MNIAFYQGQFPVGDVEGNLSKILAQSAVAKAKGVDLLFFPELALSGYPPEDLLFQGDFIARIKAAFAKLQKDLPAGITVGVGLPRYLNDQLYNALVIFESGKVLFEYHKQALPNYGVFDERRYFSVGQTEFVFEFQGKRLGLLICEDLWNATTVAKLQHQNLDCVVVINASPFEQGKRLGRLKVAEQAVQFLKAPLLYVHQVGVQDEIIYDGASFYMGQTGEVYEWPQFEEGLYILPTKIQTQQKEANICAETYQALCYALKNYVTHNKFPGVLLGLSGGIDSALVLALAVDALGADRVEAILMPSRYTASMSIEDAEAEAKALGVKYRTVPIETLFQGFLKEVRPHFDKQEQDLTEENIQARLRGMILMALSNKSGKMVLATTNKSELAVGYGTLYGDLIGGYVLLKDVYKTMVYQLVRYRNSISAVIPERVLTRAPSAELRENQTDQDSLPDYGLLDQIIKAYMEENQSQATMKQKIKGHDAEIEWVIKMINRSEYKRSQAPIGPKITARSFGKEWRMPIMNKA